MQHQAVQSYMEFVYRVIFSALIPAVPDSTFYEPDLTLEDKSGSYFNGCSSGCCNCVVGGKICDRIQKILFNGT